MTHLYPSAEFFIQFRLAK